MKKQSSTIILNNFKMVNNVSVFLGSFFFHFPGFLKRKEKANRRKSKRKYLRDLFS